MKIFFILGRNPFLSRAEILSFLKARTISYEELLFEENFLILDLPDEKEINIQEFGGVLKIGKIVFTGTNEKLEHYLEKNDIIPSDKFTYAVFGNSDPQPLKEKFKREKRKAVLKQGRKRITFQDGEKTSLASTDFSLLLHKSVDQKGTHYYGIVNQEYEYAPVKRRDMEKPIRRPHLAISPRLAKILINLSGAKKADLLLDPFCGVGGILQEALIKEISCHGIDKDKQALEDAQKNLQWLSKNYPLKTSWTLENRNSKNTPNLQFDAIATETPLGKVLKKRPSEKEAKAIIRDFEAFILPILQRLQQCKKKAAKIAITLPAISSHRVDIGKIAKKANFQLLGEPMLESRPDQFISRDIVVLE